MSKSLKTAEISLFEVMFRKGPQVYIFTSFKVALVNRAYSPFADPGPNLRLDVESATGECARFTKVTLNAFTTFSRHRHGILWVSIMFLMILQISRA